MSAQRQRERVVVVCNNCDNSLVGLNGWSYPVNLVPVTVSIEQLDAWKALGYEFDVF